MLHNRVRGHNREELLFDHEPVDVSLMISGADHLLYGRQFSDGLYMLPPAFDLIYLVGCGNGLFVDDVVVVMEVVVAAGDGALYPPDLDLVLLGYLAVVVQPHGCEFVPGVLLPPLARRDDLREQLHEQRSHEKNLDVLQHGFGQPRGSRPQSCPCVGVCDDVFADLVFYPGAFQANTRPQDESVFIAVDLRGHYFVNSWV